MSIKQNTWFWYNCRDKETNKQEIIKDYSLLFKAANQEGEYKTISEGEYEYVHEFKERINEILFL